MQRVTRFGVSVPRELLKKFDELIVKERFKNRSKAITELIRSNVSEIEFIDGSHTLIGTITYMYNPHVKSVTSKIESAMIQSNSRVISNSTTPYKGKMLGILSCSGNWFDIKDTFRVINSTKGVEFCKASFVNPQIKY